MSHGSNYIDLNKLKGSGFRVQVSEVRVQRSEVRVQRSEVRGQGLGLRAERHDPTSRGSGEVNVEKLSKFRSLVETHILITGRLDYTDEKQMNNVFDQTAEIGRMFNGFRRSIEKKI